MAQELKQLKIIAYLKPHCGWSKGVRAIMDKYNLKYEDKDIINNQADYMEMVQKSQQPLSPCVEINGKMLPDISGEEVEHYLLQQGLIKKSESPTSHPTNKSCDTHVHMFKK